ncbi:hypothetical protein [Mycobacteroides abscessus]|uniref:hypothetical protein n=1 Tax=Mycobacteroides abscessus TaxID=36809 RepID=UPI0012FFE874|nr:hypothetical protein [Mycobacteroides abscessus]
MDNQINHLRKQVIDTVRLYQSGELIIDKLATRITHMGLFDDRLMDAVWDSDPELATIVEHLAPDLEVDPDNQDYIALIVAYASQHGA